MDFEKTPELMAEFPYTVRSAVCFWILHGLDRLADKGETDEDVDRIRSSICTPTAMRIAGPTSPSRTMRSSRRLARAALLLAASWSASSCAADPQPDAGLCRPDEHVAFSCPLASKTVSLCTTGTGPITGLAYRFGRPGKIENEFVARPDNGNRFYGTISPARPGASVNQVWFDRGDVRYLLTECVGGNCPKQAGLAVLRGERVVMNARCTRVIADDHASFAHDVVTFGSDAGTSRSSTGLLVIEDADNALDRLYPPGPPR